MPDENVRFALRNLTLQFYLGRVSRRGIVKGKPKYYKTVPQVVRAYQRLVPPARLFIRPVAVYPDGSYRVIEFSRED